MKAYQQYELWFITGSQHLYGPETLKQVAANSSKIAKELDASKEISIKIVWKETVKTSDEITKTIREANNNENCIGIICWMHTFSPAKMWINGLTQLTKPFLHFHTQFNQALPWNTIDMDFMNLNQSAHGDREFGFIGTRLRKDREVICGHWSETSVQKRIDSWARTCTGWADSRSMKIARIGDNMRQVAVTEGDKVQAQIDFGYEVNGYGLGDVLKYVDAVTENEIVALVNEYRESYTFGTGSSEGEGLTSIREAAKQEIGLKRFLEAGGFKAFTTTFENLYGLHQLPGLASQRLMEAGYGFGAEGDWKTAALLRTMKAIAFGKKEGTSFMEDYTYHFSEKGGQVLGSHMLEVCPTIASKKPSLEVHKLGIGGKANPARLVFDVPAGNAINASLIDMGNRHRLIINEVKCEKAKNKLPNLPVARALWTPMPNLETGAEAWIYAGGAHHTVFSQSVTTKQMEMFAEIAGIECVVIDENTTFRELKNTLRMNECYYKIF